MRGEGRRYRYIKQRYPTIIKYIETSINSKRCPFCGKQFNRIYSVKRHLKYSSECSYLFSRLIEMMIARMDEEELRRFMGLPVEEKKEPSVIELLPNM